jgi:GxxExxY protein
MIVEDLVLIENKCLQNVRPIHEAQLLTYLRLSHRRIGFLINWNVLLIRDGIKRMVQGL